MVEPTESESKQELDRFCNAMIAIREEIRAVEVRYTYVTLASASDPLSGGYSNIRRIYPEWELIAGGRRAYGVCVRCVYVTQEGHLPKDNNMLTNAPHPASMVMADEWTYPYTREEAAFPAEWWWSGLIGAQAVAFFTKGTKVADCVDVDAEQVRQSKFWPTNRRIDNVYGDRNLVTVNPPMDAPSHVATA
eukprot:1192026-Prorocentrum_minimum.AAC.2